MRHGIITSDYDEDRSVYIIREDHHLRSHGNPMPQGYGQGLLKLQITEDMLKNLWLFSDNKDIYSIIPICGPQIKNYDDLIFDILNNYRFRESKLAKFIKNFSSYEENMKENYFQEYLMKTFCNSVIVFFDVFEKTFVKIDQNSIYREFKDKYLKFRKILITDLITNFLRGNNYRVKKRSYAGRYKWFG